MNWNFLFVSVLAALPVIATPVNRGQTVTLSGTTAASDPELIGSIIADKLIPFEIRDSLGTIKVTGNYLSRVIRSTATGKLIFAGQIQNTTNPNGTAWIDGVIPKGYGFVDVDVEYRTDGTGSIPPTQVIRSSSGDTLRFNHGTQLIIPPNESRLYSIKTATETFSDSGSVTITGSNDFGGAFFSTTISGAYIPEKVPLQISTGEIIFFETDYYLPIIVKKASVGVILRAETSTNLNNPWTVVPNVEVTAVAGDSFVYVPVNTSTEPRRFFRVFCQLPP